MSIVDERIVKMVFDNREFLANVASTITGINQLNKATDQMANASSGLSIMGKAFEQAEALSTKAGFHIQDVWTKVANVLEYQVANKIVNIGKNIANAMTFEGVSDGFSEYELKMGSVQTILAGTGESLETVNKYLEDLNKYSDQTIYSFADMTNNIGKFTNAGVKLEDAVLAIKGIANEAAISGANANEASRAMYNFSQALSAGYVKLIDWKSIENANMATKGFKDTLLEVASAVGTVEKQENGMYKILTTNAQGKTMEDLVDGTKNFNDSLQQQWMTTEVLTKALKIYATDVRSLSEEEKRAYEEELKAMGLSDAQVAQFEALGSKATDAASEIKTFSMMIDTLKEAIGSGWAQTFEILIGDFEEAKALWTEVGGVLGDLIDDMSSSRNELLKGWDALGGRRVIIDSLKRAFDALVSVIKPISEGFRNIFPPVTAQNLYNISKAIQRFTANLKISEETAVKVRQVASGFFSIFDIGLKIVTAFVKAILPAGKGISSLGGFLLDVAASIGNFITKVDLLITRTKLFDRVFSSIGDTIKPIFDAIKSGAKGLITLLGDLFSGFVKAAGPITSVGDIFKNVTDGMSNSLSNMKERLDKLSPFFEGLRNLFEGLGTALGSVFKQIGDSISSSFAGGDIFGNLLRIVNLFLTGGILKKLSDGASIFSSIEDAIDKFGDTLDSFSKKLEAEALMNIAKAVAILAGSLVVVSLIDSDKLAGATTAITAMMFGMAGAITVLMKAINSFSPTDVTKSFKVFGKELFGSNVTQILEMSVTLGAVAKALIAMGSAVLMMSVGLKIISTAAKDGHLWDSFAVISLLLAELTGVALVLSKFGGDKSVKGLIGLTAALVIMSEALKVISGIVEGGNAWESLAILSIILGELTGVVLLVENFTKFNMGSMLPLVSLAVSLNLVVIALKSVSDALGSEGNHIWESLGVISIMLAELAAITVLMGQFGGFAAIGGLGAIMAAAALLIMVQALKQISDALGQTDQHVWQALGVIAASLLVLAVGLTAMAATVPGAAGLLIASVALIALGGALKIMGSLKLSEIGKGLLAMAGSLIILAVGLTAMIVALPGAIALVVAAAGLTALAGALKLFGSMSLAEIGKALITLTAALSGIAIMCTALSVTAPFVLVFSAALLVFGAAMMATGAGLTLFAAGLSAILPLLPVAASAITILGTALLNLLPVVAEKLVEAFAVLAQKIAENAPAFGQAILAIIGIMLDALAGSAIKFGETVLQLILGMLQVLTENIPLIAQAGTDLMIAYMQAIATEIPRVVDEAYKCAIALIDGLATAIESNNGELIAAVDHLMSAVIQAIAQWLVEFTPLGLLIPDNMKEGIMSGEFNVKDAVGNVIKGAVDAIKGFVGDFKLAAENLIGGFIDGLKGSFAGQAISACVNFGNDCINALNSKRGLDEHSASKRTTESGEYYVEGFENGVDNKKDEAIEKVTEFGDSTIGALDESVANGAEGIEASVGSITDSLFSMSDNTDKANESSKGFMQTLMDEWNAISKLDDASKANIQTEERWGTTLKQANAAVQKSNEGRWGTTLQVMEASKKSAKATEEETEKTEKNTEAKEANAKASGKSAKATKTEADFMEQASGVVEAFTKNYGHLYDQLGEDEKVQVATDAIKKLAEETWNASQKASDAADENKKTAASMDDLIKTFSDMKNKIYNSVKSMFEGDSFFQKFEVKTEKTMKDMLEGMRSNVNAVASWTSKLAELGEKGLDQGLLKQLAELGPKGYEYVNAFSTATAEEIQEANQLFAQAGQLPESSSNTILASYAQAGINAVAGFANGMNENVGNAVEAGSSMGFKTLEGLEGALEEQSPSRRTYRDGRYLIMGLVEGIINNVFSATNAVLTLCNRIKSVLDTEMAMEKFYDYGKNVALGIAEGMLSDESVAAVKKSATKLSQIAAKVTEDYNEIESPSKRYSKYGGYIAQGFANGMTNGAAYVEQGAMVLSETIRNALGLVQDIAENDMELHPVISPILDTSEISKSAKAIGTLFPGTSLAMASRINLGSSVSGYENDQEAASNMQQINFTQNNYSPKPLSRIEIYRDTKNSLSMMKGMVMAHG